MIAVPVARPHTVPVVAPTVATAGLLLLQVPPETELVSVLHVNAHMLVIPIMGPGVGNTVTVYTA
jgi:hypothetical protein